MGWSSYRPRSANRRSRELCDSKSQLVSSVAGDRDPLALVGDDRRDAAFLARVDDGPVKECADLGGWAAQGAFASVAGSRATATMGPTAGPVLTERRDTHAGLTWLAAGRGTVASLEAWRPAFYNQA